MKLSRFVSILTAVMFIVGAFAGGAQQNPIFADGFESGSTGAWSVTFPPVPSNISVTLVDTSATSPVGGDESMAIFAVRFFIHNNDPEQAGDIFIKKTWIRSLVPSLSSGFALAIKGNTGQEYTPGTVGTQMSAWCETLNRFLWMTEGGCPGDTDTHFAVDGDREFIITGVFTNRPGGTTGFYRMVLNGFVYDHDGSGDGDFIHTSGFPMQTDSKLVQNADIINLVPDAFPNEPRYRLFDTSLEFKIETVDGTATIVPLNL